MQENDVPASCQVGGNMPSKAFQLAMQQFRAISCNPAPSPLSYMHGQSTRAKTMSQDWLFLHPPEGYFERPAVIDRYLRDRVDAGMVRVIRFGQISCTEMKIA